MGQLILYALRLGTFGFGGPIALVGYMHRDLVEQRKWISEEDYREGLALSQLAPGPLAAQLAIYLGFVHYRILGATLVGLAFVLPSFFMVVAIIAISAYKLTTKTVGKDRLLWAFYLVAAAVTVVTESEIVWLFLIAGIVAWLVKAPPKRGLQSGMMLAVAAGLPTAAGVASVVDWPLLLQIALFFGEAGAFVFGSGLAIVPFLYGSVVNEHHWLSERQFIDAVAVAMITPGPVVITVGFIGYLIAGFPGATVAALATFLPCYLFTIIPAPYFHKYGKRPGIIAFVDGVTAAAVGTITGAVVVLGKRSITDIPTLAMLLITLLLLWKVKKLPEPVIIAAAAVAGLIAFPLVKS